MGQIINTGNQSIGGRTFTTAYSPSASEMGGGTNKAGAGMVSGGVISGLADIANGFINAQRTKNTYKFNAGMADLQGRMIRLQAGQEIKNIRKKALAMFGAQQAGFAKAGFAFTGSPAQVMLDTQREFELDQIFTGINADLQISSLQTGTGIKKMEAKSEQYNALQNTYKSILTMATDYAKRG